MPTIDLRNDTNEYIVLQLSHAAVCKKVGRCVCMKPGTPRSIHIAPQCWNRGLPDAVLASEELQKLIARKAVFLKSKPPMHDPEETGVVEKVQKPRAKNSGRPAAQTVKEST